MFNTKKIKELTEKTEKLAEKNNNLVKDFYKLWKAHFLLIEHLNLIEKYKEVSTFDNYFEKTGEKKLIGYEPVKRCKTCKKIQNDNFKN